MKKNLLLWQFAGFVLATLGGTLLHFVYDWCGGPVAAVFSGVNESTWEHMKLLYCPMVAFAVVQSRFFRDHPRFWCVKLRGILTGLILIPVLFYTYNGAVGPSPDWMNIVIFFVAAAVAYGTEWRRLGRRGASCPSRWAIAAVAAVGVLFVVFTFWPPQLPLFRDPLTGGYGV